MPSATLLTRPSAQPGVLKGRSRERWVETWPSPSAAQREGLCRRQIVGHSQSCSGSREEGREGQVPGSGRRRPWETPESLLTGKRYRVAKATHHGPAPSPLGLQPASPPRPPLGSEHCCARRGGRSKAAFPRSLDAHEAPALSSEGAAWPSNATRDSLAATALKRPCASFP